MARGGVNNNPEGVNGHGPPLPPASEEMRDAMQTLTLRPGMSDKRMLLDLKDEYGIDLRTVRTLRTRKRQCNVITVRKVDMPLEEAMEIYTDKVNENTRHAIGVSKHARDLRTRGILIPRDICRELDKICFPDDAEARRRRGRKIVRVPLTSLGPNDEWCSDGHDKLQWLTGLAIFAFRDKFSGFILGLWVLPAHFHRQQEVVAYLFLLLVRARGGIPIQLNTDSGSEIKIMQSMILRLRREFAPHIDEKETPAFIQLPSYHNTPIERLWRPLQEQCTNSLKDTYRSGVENGIFDASNDFQMLVFLYVWVPFSQALLDRWVFEHNSNPTRKQKDKILPSGFAPSEAYTHPERCETKYEDQLIPVDPHFVDELMSELQESTPTDLQFINDAEFLRVADEIWLNKMEDPTVTIHNVWDLFSQLHNALLSSSAE